MQYSHSRIECFEKCKLQFYCRYIEGLTTIFAPGADNPLIVGSAMHLGLEKGPEAMEDYYCKQYPVMNDEHVNEMIKLGTLVGKAQKVVGNLVREKDVSFEYEISVPEFKGYVDLIIHNRYGTIEVYDFKYSNNIDHYLESKQLHLYKYFLEKLGFKVSKLGFVFIPKTYIRQKKTEDLYQFRKRLKETLDTMEVRTVEVSYDQQKVENFFESCEAIKDEKEYEKTRSKLCDWCEFKKYCEGDMSMILPKNERREKKRDINPDIWIYADSYVGKSTFVDGFDNLLFINTDGNVDNTTSPVVRIKDEVTYEGRLKKEKMAWEVLLEAIAELEKKDNSFERVAIDLVEDVYEHCRLYKYNKLNIDHEQDAGFGKGWDMVRTEFLSAMKKLKNLGYQVIFISKELSSEITLKNGNKITTIKPNMNDKVANVLTGMVDLTVRAYMDGEERYIQLEKKENVFGGGRFKFKESRVKLDKDEFIKALEAAQDGIDTYTKVEKKDINATKERPSEESKQGVAASADAKTSEVVPEKPVRKGRSSNK